MTLKTRQYNIVAYMIWLLPVSFFAYQFILRLFPSLIMQQLMVKFAIDATEFGMFSSIYYLGYASFQIPLAILLDTYKPKYVMFLCVALCGAATLLFSTTDNWSLLLFSRFCIGAASAVAFLGISKIASVWFDANAYSKIIGYSFTIGLCGAIYGGRPINILIEQLGWQQMCYILALAAFIISALIILFLRTPPLKNNNLNQEKLSAKDIGFLLKNPIIWLLAASNLLMVGALEGFADVWGVSYLMTAYDITKSQAAQLISFIFFGMLFGGPLLAFLAQRYGNYNILVSCGLLMMIIFFLLLFCKEIFNYFLLAGMFGLLGILCCYQVIIFASGANIILNKIYLGITIAFLNSINMLGGSFFHSVIGFIMDKYWTGVIIEGVRFYELSSYSAALVIIPICAFIGSVLIVAIKIISREYIKY